MKKIYILLLAFFSILQINAQVSLYSFAQSTGTYTPIIGGTVYQAAGTGTFDSEVWSAQSIGFTFNFNGTDFTTFGINANGWISMGSTVPTSSSAPIASSTNNVITAAGRDLFSRQALTASTTSGSATITVTAGSLLGIFVGDAVSGTGIATGSTVLSKTATTVTLSANATSTGTGRNIRFHNGTIRFETIGSSPSRKLIVQFTNYSRFVTGAPSDVMNFQIVLNETTNIIDLIYDFQYINANGTHEVGLRGAAITDYNNRTTTTNWSATAAGTFNTSSCSVSNTVRPTSGLTFTYTQPTCIRPSAQTASVTTLTSATLNWTNSPTALLGCIFELRTSGLPGSGATGLVSNGTTGANVATVELTTLTPATSYNFYIKSACDTATNSAWTTATTFNTNCPIPTLVSNTNATTASLNFGWTNNALATSGVQYEVRTSGVAGSGATGLFTSGTLGVGVSSVSIFSLAANTSYSFYVKSDCGSSVFSGWTTAVTGFTGYCITTNTGSQTYISNFSTTNGLTNISNLASGYTATGYQDNYNTQTVSAYQNNIVNVGISLVGGSSGVAAWVDWNNNLIFETAERVFNSGGYLDDGSYTSTILVPGTAVAGDYRMRIKVDYDATSPNPCTNVGARTETEDYQFTVVTQPQCAGAPTVATISPMQTILCPTATVTLTAVGFAKVESGYSSMWQVSPDGISNWVNVTTGTGATSTTYVTAPFVSGSQYYRYSQTCSFSAETSYSNNALVIEQSAPATQVTNVVCSAPTPTSLPLSWANGNGNRRIVYINNVNTFTDPTSASPGTPTTVYSGSNQQLIYDSTGSAVTVTGLLPLTTYYLRAYDANRCSVNVYYFNTSGSTNNPATIATIALPLTSVATGNWSDGSTWNTGVAPICSDIATVLATHVVTVNSTSNVIKNLTIAGGGSLVIANGDLTIGCTKNNNVLSNNGTLSVNGGTLNLNGNYSGLIGSVFNQTGGDFNIDGNTNGLTSDSVASGTPLFQIVTATGTVTGGTLTIVDPPAAAGAARAFQMNFSTGTLQWGAGHTLSFGNGISTDASANLSGFQFDTYVGSASTQSMIGSLVVNSGNAANRWVTTSSVSGNGSFVKGNLTINSDSELRDIIGGGTLVVGGNIINNGTLSMTSVPLSFGTYTGSTLGAAIAAQTVSGSGIFRNAVASPTTQFTSVTINNPLGVTFPAGDVSMSGALTLNGTTVQTIPTGTDYIVGGIVTVAASSTLTVESDANLYQTGTAANSGNIISKRSTTMKRLDYTFWSSPVTGQNLLGLSPDTLPTRFYTYGGTGTAFTPVSASATTMLKGVGYSVRAPNTFSTTAAPFTGSFKGVPNNGDVTFASVDAQYSLIGNPYPSTVNATLFLAANPGTLYFWTHENSSLDQSVNNYASYNTTGAVSPGLPAGTLTPNGTIQVGQGFMYSRSGVAGGKFTNAMRTVSSSTQFFRTAQESSSINGRLWLNLKSSTENKGQILVGYVDNTTNGFDASYDGTQIHTEGTVLSSLIGNEAMVIQAKPTFTTADVVPLSFKTDVAGTYEIAIDHVDGLFSNGQDVYIKDNLLGSTTLITTNAYSFVSQIGTFNNRFELRYSAALSTTNNVLDANTVVVFSNNNELNLNATTSIKTVKVFDIRGRSIFEQANINLKSTALKGLTPQKQVLLVQITDDANNVVTKKVIF